LLPALLSGSAVAAGKFSTWQTIFIMSFTTDKQTLDDLNIFGKRGSRSIYEIFNRTSTRGGADILEQMFRYPLSKEEDINRRSEIIRYFGSLRAAFPFQSDLFDTTEQYLSSTDERSKLSQEDNTLGRKFNSLMGTDTEYKLLAQGVSATIEILISLSRLVESIRSSAVATPYRDDINDMEGILHDPELDKLVKENASGKLSYAVVADYDKLLRYVHRDKIKKLLFHIYTLDVYIAVAKVAAERKFVFPQAVNREQHIIKLEGVYHPQLSNPVPNTLHITPQSNIVFLTGANMAGKSTFMKSLGIALFLAHMGFPVAAAKMEFSVRDGIYTTINLPDNLSMGYSHFYAEVLRVKKVAQQLSQSKNLFIIFDELFRGTNVKDAYEATVAITAAFAQKRNCMFVVSTHIIEAGEVLKEKCDNINFTYLPTRMKDNKPVYTYTLEPGITADRHGMIIINNEGIIDIIRSRTHKTNQP
jgi:DNA mismatch repair protein MutS